MAGGDGGVDPGRDVGRANDVRAHRRHAGIEPPRAVLPRSDITADAVLRRLRVHEPTSLAAVGEAAVAIECETEMRSQRGDGRVLLRIRVGIGCGNDDDPEPAAILASRRQHRCSQCITLPVAQREEKRHLSLYMGIEADVALDRVGPFRTPGLDCLLPLAAEIFLDCVAHQARLMRRFTFRLDTEPGLTLRRVANILHFAHPAIAAILGRRARKANMRFAPVYNAARSYNGKFGCNTARLLPERRW